MDCDDEVVIHDVHVPVESHIRDVASFADDASDGDLDFDDAVEFVAFEDFSDFGFHVLLSNSCSRRVTPIVPRLLLVAGQRLPLIRGDLWPAPSFEGTGFQKGNGGHICPPLTSTGNLLIQHL